MMRNYPRLISQASEAAFFFRISCLALCYKNFFTCIYTFYTKLSQASMSLYTAASKIRPSITRCSMAASSQAQRPWPSWESRSSFLQPPICQHVWQQQQHHDSQNWSHAHQGRGSNPWRTLPPPISPPTPPGGPRPPHPGPYGPPTPPRGYRASSPDEDTTIPYWKLAESDEV